MTVEDLEKGNSLKEEIRNLKYSLETIKNRKYRKLSSISIGGECHIRIPEEISEKVEMLLEIEFASMLKQKQKEFDELGNGSKKGIGE